MSRKTIQYSALITTLLILFIAGYAYWQHEKRYPSTDDAYIQAHTIDIASQVNGKVQRVFVKNQQQVAKNELLFTIDPKPYEIALQQAQANLENTKQQIKAEQNAVKAARAALAQNQAQLLDTQKNHDRIMILLKKGFYAKSGADDAARELTVAKQAVMAAQDNLNEIQAKLGKNGDGHAQLQSAQAQLAQAQLQLHYTKIYAPHNGQLAKLTLRPGQTVTAYQSLFSLVDNNSWWVTANLKETSLSRVRVGQKVVVQVDMYPSHPFEGIVKSISPSSGSSFSLLPSENATGNWVKVTQRFPVRIDIIHPNKQYPLRIGASCTVTIDTQ